MFNPADLERLNRELAEARAKLAVAEAAAREAAEERNRLRQELTSLREQYEESEKAVHYLTQRDYAITREDIADLESHGVPLAQVLEELEAIVKGTPDG